jgi:transcriptional regulator with XRE-family HTH domain
MSKTNHSHYAANDLGTLTKMANAETGSRIKLALIRKGWTITRLAEELGVRQPTLSAVLTGKRPGTKHFEQIAKLLDVPLTWITTGHPIPSWINSLEETAELALERGKLALKETSENYLNRSTAGQLQFFADHHSRLLTIKKPIPLNCFELFTIRRALLFAINEADDKAVKNDYVSLLGIIEDALGGNEGISNLLKRMEDIHTTLRDVHDALGRIKFDAPAKRTKR